MNKLNGIRIGYDDYFFHENTISTVENGDKKHVVINGEMKRYHKVSYLEYFNYIDDSFLRADRKELTFKELKTVLLQHKRELEKNTITGLQQELIEVKEVLKEVLNIVKRKS